MLEEGFFGEGMGDDNTAFESLDDLFRASMAKMQVQTAAAQAARASKGGQSKKPKTLDAGSAAARSATY